MKSVKILFVTAAVILSIMPMRVYASDYQGKEKDDSLFQKLGDLITGKYEVKGKPIKKTGIIQVTADQIKEIKPAPAE